MSAFYEGLRDTADRLIEQFGHVVTLKRTDRQGDITTRDSAMVVVETVRRELEGSRVKVGDLKILLDSSAEPVAGDTFVRDGKQYAIRQEINPIKPAGVVLAYEAFAGPA